MTPNGLAWLRVMPSELRAVEALIHPMAERVKEIYRKWGVESELTKDGRPKLHLIWKNFYEAQLYASATHYIIFDEVEDRGGSLIPTLGSVGSIFLSGMEPPACPPPPVEAHRANPHESEPASPH